jgi:hypothetical protein
MQNIPASKGAGIFFYHLYVNETEVITGNKVICFIWSPFL